MTDILRAVGFTAKAIRTGFACVGAAVDALAPFKPVFGHPLPNPTTSAAGAGAERPEAVSSVPPAPASGHLPAEAADGYRRLSNDPQWRQSVGLPAEPLVHRGVPTFAALQQLLTIYAAAHADLRYDGRSDGWSCQCGQPLEKHEDGAFAALRDHLAGLQASALSFAIQAARNTEAQK